MRKRILICHPDLESEVTCIGLDVRFNPSMDKYRKTGRYVMPDGSRVLPEDVSVSDRFTEYGYDDIWYLLWAGIIREEEVPLFYVMQEFSSYEKQFYPRN